METNKKSDTNVVKGYIRYLKLERNFSPNTLEAYRHDLQLLAAYCQREQRAVESLSLADLQHFASTLHEQGIGPTSQARVLSGVRSFYRYLRLEGYIADDPTELLEWPRLGLHLPEVLTTAEVDQLERVVKYTFSNVGNTFSAKSISDYLKAEHRALDNETVYSYLEKLEKAYLLHRCSRFDLQGKEILKTQEKFYLADTALRYSVLGYNADSVASSLENVVYLELCRRGYTVNVGKSGSGEIDFVAVRQNEKLSDWEP